MEDNYKWYSTVLFFHQIDRIESVVVDCRIVRFLRKTCQQRIVPCHRYSLVVMHKPISWSLHKLYLQVFVVTWNLLPLSWTAVSFRRIASILLFVCVRRRLWPKWRALSFPTKTIQWMCITEWFPTSWPRWDLTIRHVSENDASGVCVKKGFQWKKNRR